MRRAAATTSFARHDLPIDTENLSCMPLRGQFVSHRLAAIRRKNGGFRLSERRQSALRELFRRGSWIDQGAPAPTRCDFAMPGVCGRHIGGAKQQSFNGCPPKGLGDGREQKQVQSRYVLFSRALESYEGGSLR